MSTFAVSMVKDEADVIVPVIRRMAGQVDGLIVADNGSTDGTRDILADLARDLPLTVVDDPDPAYLQSVKMTRLAGMAAERGACWVVPFDADEVWHGPVGLTVAEMLATFNDGGFVVSAEILNHMATGLDDPTDLNPVTRLNWRMADPLPLRKVACRWRSNLTIHQGNHGCDYGGTAPASIQMLTVRHFPYRSAEQMISKTVNGAAAYAAAGDRVPADAGAHWRQHGEIHAHSGDDAVRAIFDTYYYRADPTVTVELDGVTLPPLVHDPVPR